MTVRAFPRVLTMAIMMAMAVGLVPSALMQTASAQQDVAVQPPAQTDKFIWKKRDIPRWDEKAPYGKPYHFAVVASPQSYYLTAETPRLRVKILRANGRIVVRTYPLFYGHDDLVWQPVFGKKAKPLKAWVPRVSWQGEKRPETQAYRLDYGY